MSSVFKLIPAALAAALFISGFAACRTGRVERAGLEGAAGREQALSERLEKLPVGSPARAKVLRELERVRYFRAKEEDTIESWRYYLEHHREGVFLKTARESLARVRFERAKRLGKWWYWRYFLTVHPESGYSSDAEKHFEETLASELGSDSEERKLREFLRRFPRSAHKGRVLNLLAEREYKRVVESGDSNRMELFLKLFPDSPLAKDIKIRMEGEWRRRIASTGKWEDLDSYKERYPGSGYTEELTLAVAGRMLDKAAAALDSSRIRSVADRMGEHELSERALSLAALIDKSEKSLNEIRDLVSGSMPYRPRAALATLIAGAAGDNLRTAWLSALSLSHYAHPEAFEMLFQMTGSSPWTLSTAGFSALEAWFGYHDPEITVEISRGIDEGVEKRKRAASDALRYGVLRAFSKGLDRDGVDRLREAGKAGRHRLQALSAELAGVYTEGGPRQGLINEFFRAVDEKRNEIEKVLSSEVTGSNLPALESKVYEMQALMELLRITEERIVRIRGADSAGVDSIRRIRGEMDGRLKSAIREVVKINPDSDVDMRFFINRERENLHQKSRLKYWRLLNKRKDKLSRELVRILCSRKGWSPEVCTDKDVR